MVFRKFFEKYTLIVCVLCAALITVSCSHKLGYSTVLWSSPENGLYAGDIVKVYIKSNISQVYVIGVQGSNQKIEVPFWQIMEPGSKSEVQKAYQPYAEYRSIYAHVAIDGLPVRYEPVNTSRQIYRLRKGEVLKVLTKGTGAAPMSGSKPLEGDWLWVMTSDGTTGWCFSYNLRLFDENNPQIAEQAVEEFDETLDAVLSKLWYPEEYQQMINGSRIDLEAFSAQYFFDPGKESGEVLLNVPELSMSWPYKGAVKQENGSYKFTDTPLTLNIRRNDYIVLQYADGRGMPKSYTLVSIDTPISEIIASEVARRAAQYEWILSFGTSFKSSNYGDLLFMEDNSFVWTGYQRLIPAVISSGSGERGTVSFNHFLDVSLSTTYDGVITFTFERTNKSVSFLYKVEPTGIRLEETTNAVIKNGVVTTRGANALILFFGKE